MSFLIPGISIVAPIIVLFLVRGLESAKRSVVNETNLVRIMEDVPHQREQITDIYKQLNEVKTEVAIIDDRVKRLVGG